MKQSARQLFIYTDRKLSSLEEDCVFKSLDWAFSDGYIQDITFIRTKKCNKIEIVELCEEEEVGFTLNSSPSLSSWGTTAGERWFAKEQT